jgi:hypothetical protein
MTTTATTSVFTFDTSHHALWAEDVAREMAVPVEVIPAPPQSGSKCDLALRTIRPRADELEQAFQGEGIEFRRWDWD